MRTDFTSIAELSADDVEAAFDPPRSNADTTPRQRVLALLLRMTEVARPAVGDARRILELLGRVAACSWVEGQLAIAVRAVGDGSELDVLTYDGLSYSRLRQPMLLPISLDEFVVEVAKNGGTFGALHLNFDEPSVEIQLAAFEAPPDSVNLPEAMLESDPPPSRKSTSRLAAVRLPEEAFPSEVEPGPPTPGARSWPKRER